MQATIIAVIEVERLSAFCGIPGLEFQGLGAVSGLQTLPKRAGAICQAYSPTTWLEPSFWYCWLPPPDAEVAGEQTPKKYVFMDDGHSAL